jgi:hypothetical protein
MTEAATCRKFVLPKLLAAGWDEEPHLIAEQCMFTEDRIVIPEYDDDGRHPQFVEDAPRPNGGPVWCKRNTSATQQDRLVPVEHVILSPSLNVTLSEAKSLLPALRVNSVKNRRSQRLFASRLRVTNPYGFAGRREPLATGH